jgi:hypothetical protein
MKAKSVLYHIVHDGEGRILAMVPAGAVETSGGLQLGWRPLPAINQFVTDVRLTPALARIAPREILDEFVVRSGGNRGTGRLRRRSRKG